jgi:cytochrome c oxidase subunit 3
MSQHAAVTPDALAPHDSAVHAEHYDPVACKIGMWLFLFTEVLLFGTLFIVFAVYLTLHHFDFSAGSRQLDKLLGAANTMILLTSSLTMALSIAAIQRSNRRLSVAMLTVTMLLGLAFLGIKAHEWHHKFQHDLYPRSATMLAKPYGQQVFYGLYYTMTGLHALHVIAGCGAILAAMALVGLGRIHAGRYSYMENAGLYWHLVDVIWILLFPLFYLIG